MKFFKCILTLVLLCTSHLAFATNQNGCDPCDPCVSNKSCDLCDIDFCDMEFFAYIDALYWHVCKGDLNTEDHGGKTRYLCPEYDWGYRLGGVARYNNWDLGVRYTSFYSRSSKSFKECSGSAKFKFDYDVVDIELGYNCCLDCCDISVRPFMGAKLAWIDDKFDKSDRGSSESDMDYHGYGLYLGLEGRWDLCSYCACDRDIPIALVAHASTGILDSEFKQDVENDGCDRGRECAYIPVHEVFAGLDFRFCDLCSLDANFQVGYEAQYWGWREYNDSEDITHLGLGGLVLRFGANF